MQNNISSVVWVIDDILLERHDDVGFPSMMAAVLEAGYDLYMTKYKPFCGALWEMDRALTDILDEDGWFSTPVVCYGSIGFLKLWQRFKPYVVPGFYYNDKVFDYSNYSSVYGDMMLNNDFIMLPYGEVVRRVRSLISSRFFIRPNVVTKSFPGRVIDFDDIAETPEALNQYEHIKDDEICIIAPVKPITHESRHVIVNGEVITASTYRSNDVLDIRIDVHPKSVELAEIVAKNKWQPDKVYVVDIAFINDYNVSKIIEFNTFSCSGLYACDTRKIVKAVSEAAIKECLGDNDED